LLKIYNIETGKLPKKLTIVRATRAFMSKRFNVRKEIAGAEARGDLDSAAVLSF